MLQIIMLTRAQILSLTNLSSDFTLDTTWIIVRQDAKTGLLRVVSTNQYGERTFDIDATGGAPAEIRGASRPTPALSTLVSGDETDGADSGAGSLP